MQEADSQYLIDILMLLPAQRHTQSVLSIGQLITVLFSLIHIVMSGRRAFGAQTGLGDKKRIAAII